VPGPGFARPFEVFARFLKLGLSSFGGPVAHLGYFRREFVERCGWLGDAQYGEIVALCSVLPGPTSSQVGILVGTMRAGPLGGLLAWLAFTAPSALILALFGLALRSGTPAAQSPILAGALRGLSSAAAAVVALAVVSMARSLTKTLPTRLVASGAFALALLVNHTLPQLQWLPLAAGGLAGYFAIAQGVKVPESSLLPRGSRSLALIALALLAAGLLGLPLLAQFSPYLALFSTFFRAGSLVFGGGHVVLPFLETLISPGSIASHEFFAGYGMAQAMPGPLFAFASFLGAANRTAASGWPGALTAALGIFLPSFLLLAAALPLWGALRSAPRAGAVLAGVNAAVVGLLGAVFIDPVARTLLAAPWPIAIAVAAYLLLDVVQWPAWLVVLAAACTGALGALAGVRGAG
jgi:chromate transporter